jgi:hypothetical protein
MCRSLPWADSLSVPYSEQTLRMLGKGGVQPSFFRNSSYVFWLYTPEQIGSSYFLFIIVTLTFSTTTCRIYLLYLSYEFFDTTCCLYRLPSCPEINWNLFQDVHNGIQKFLSTESSIFLGCGNENSCGGELGSISPKSSSPKCKARHSILKKLDLDRVA